MTKEALLIKDTLQSMLEKEIANEIVVRENEIYVLLSNGARAKITLKNVA